jgi:uncharacterized Zn finger protein
MVAYDNWLLGPCDRSTVDIECPKCGESHTVDEVSELGVVWYEPEECTECGTNFCDEVEPNDEEE